MQHKELNIMQWNGFYKVLSLINSIALSSESVNHQTNIIYISFANIILSTYCIMTLNEQK